MIKMTNLTIGGKYKGCNRKGGRYEHNAARVEIKNQSAMKKIND